jgi:hypothetical protein
LCERLEFRIVPYLLPFGDFVDGFGPQSSAIHERSVALHGQCWFLPGAGAGGSFEAHFGLGTDGSLTSFELRFGDPAIVAAARILPVGTPEVVERDLFGYRTTIRRGASIFPGASLCPGASNHHGASIRHGASLSEERAPFVFHVIKL